MDRDTAVTLAVKDSVREGIFADFVREHGTEVQNMLYTQFNMDDALDAVSGGRIRTEGWRKQ